MDSTFGWIGISWWLVVGSISIQSLLPWECCHKLWVQQGARSWDMFWTPILWGHICLVISSFFKWFGCYNLEGVWLDIGCTCGYNNWDWRGRSFWLFARNLQTYWLLRSSFILMWLPYCHAWQMHLQHIMRVRMFQGAQHSQVAVGEWGVPFWHSAREAKEVSILYKFVWFGNGSKSKPNTHTHIHIYVFIHNIFVGDEATSIQFLFWGSRGVRDLLKYFLDEYHIFRRHLKRTWTNLVFSAAPGYNIFMVFTAAAPDAH